MSFIFTRYGDRSKEIPSLFYTSTNLKFIYVSSWEEGKHTILYKSDLNTEDTEILIPKLIENFAKYNTSIVLPYYNKKYIDIDAIFSKLLDSVSTDLILKLNFDFPCSKDLDIKLFAYNAELNSGLTISSTLDNKKIISDDGNMSFDDKIRFMIKNISFKIKSIIDSANNTDFDKINNYLFYIRDYFSIDLSYGRHQILLDYKNFNISQQELDKFNKFEIDYNEIENIVKNYHNEYQTFYNILISLNTSINLRYDSFKLTDTEEYDSKILKMHVPFISEYDTIKINGKNLDYSILNRENVSHSIMHINSRELFTLMTKLYFCIFKKYKLFNKFKDRVEKGILK